MPFQSLKTSRSGGCHGKTWLRLSHPSFLFHHPLAPSTFSFTPSLFPYSISIFFHLTGFRTNSCLRLNIRPPTLWGYSLWETCNTDIPRRIEKVIKLYSSGNGNSSHNRFYKNNMQIVYEYHTLFICMKCIVSKVPCNFLILASISHFTYPNSHITEEKKRTRILEMTLLCDIIWSWQNDFRLTINKPVLTRDSITN